MKLKPRTLAAACVALAVGASSVTVGVVATAAAPRSSAGATQSAADQRASCAEVAVVAVDATGNGWSSMTAAGPTMRVLVDALQDQLGKGGTSVATYHLGRPFAAVETLAGTDTSKSARESVTSKRATAWRAGTGEAADAVLAKLRALASACPEQTFLLTGIVQGAGAVHRALVTAQDDSTLATRVAGATLVSDPYRTASTRSELRGAPAAAAAGSGALVQRGEGVGDVPGSGRDLRVVSVCTAGDLVCDLRGWTVEDSLASFKTSLSTNGRAQLAAAAGRLVERTGAWPRVVPGQSVAVRPDVSFSAPVDVRVGSAYAGTTVFAADGSLPTGISLSRSGVLSGKVSGPGSWVVGYTVRGTAPATTVARGTIRVTATQAAFGRKLAAGGQTTCMVDDKSSAYCLGDNATGQLGNGTTTDRSSPSKIGTGTDWAALDASGATTCGVKKTGQLYCWGMNNRGQLGIGSTGQRATPQRVGTSSEWKQVSTSWLHTCAVRQTGELYCWGENNQGQLGIGSLRGQLRPTRVGTGSDWKSVSAGGWHTCAVKTNGSAWCWGLNDLGQLGTGTARLLRPGAVASDREWESLDTTWSSTCGLTVAGYAMCWGLNDQGQLGDGTRANRSRPTMVAGDRTWTDLTVGDAFACGLDDTGKALCWGENTYGQLGDGTRQDTQRPVRVAGGKTWTQLDAGWLHVCGLTGSGSLQCWGNNEAGQLARGDKADRSTPPGVAAKAAVPFQARRATRNTVVTSFNVLGSQHTRPGGGARNYAPGRIRSEWMMNQLRGLRSGIVAFQEIQVDQYLDVRRALGGRYDMYPRDTRRPKVVWQSIMWDASQWELKEAKDIWVPVIGTTRPNPLVRLRNKATGKDVWVLNVHNSSRYTPARQRERNRAVRIEIGHILEKRRAGVPVIFLGDMNERATVFCKVTGQTDLEAVTGGSNTGGHCRPPRSMHLDWMFASPELGVQRAGFIRNPLIARITDHSILSSTMSVP